MNVLKEINELASKTEISHDDKKKIDSRRVQDLEEELKDLREIVTKMDELINRNKILGRLK